MNLMTPFQIKAYSTFKKNKTKSHNFLPHTFTSPDLKATRLTGVSVASQHFLYFQSNKPALICAKTKHEVSQCQKTFGFPQLISVRFHKHK